MSQALSLDVILSTIDKASGPLRSINKASGKTAQQLKATRQQLKQLQGQQNDLTSFRALQKASKNVRGEFAAATERSNQLKRQLKETITPTKALIRKFDKATEATKRLRQQHINHLQTLRETREELSRAGISTENLSDNQRELTLRIGQSNRALEGHQRQLDATRRKQERLNTARDAYRSTRGMAGSMAGAGMASTAAGTATLLAVAKTASVGMDFDATMSKVQALTRLDKTSAELAELRTQARELGATTIFSATQAASGQSFLAMAGFSPNAIKKAMPGILTTAAAAGVEIATAADIGSNILSGFNLDASQMGRVGDVLTSAFTKGNTDLVMLGETMKYVAPVAEGLGISLEMAAAMSAQLGSSGIQSSMAGTGLKAIFNRLASGPKMARKALAGLNIETADTLGNLRPIQDILADLDKATSNMGDTQRQAAYTKIAGLEAVSALMILTKKAGAGELQDLHKQIKEDIGASQKIADVMNDNAAGDLKELISSIQDVAIEITQLNDGSLRELFKNITGITRGIGDWIRENPELAATIAKVVTVAGALLLGFGAIALVLSALLMPFALLRFGLMAVGLSGLKVGGLFSKLGSGLMWLGRVALPFLGKAFLALGRILLANPIIAIISAIAYGAYLIYNNWDGIAAWWGKTWNATKSHFNAFKVYLKSWWKGVGGTFGGALLDISAKLLNWSPFGVIYAGISKALNDLGIELPKKFSDFGGMLIDGLISGITNKAAALRNSILGVGDNISGWFKDKLDINSPSKVFIKHGQSVMHGLEKGLDNNKNTLSPITNISKRLKQAGAGLAIGMTAMPAVALDNRAPLSMQSAASTGGGVVIQKLEIHAAPGMDEQALARFIAIEINKREQQQRTRARSSFNDLD
ncbi:MAG: hypothetical protein OFPI_00060 [Osedax symbiont Rs2]|nr:MAG: hypothetical protein OFPI_00060 [Osedax symbiont Rs2]